MSGRPFVVTPLRAVLGMCASRRAQARRVTSCHLCCLEVALVRKKSDVVLSCFARLAADSGTAMTAMRIVAVFLSRSSLRSKLQLLARLDSDRTGGRLESGGDVSFLPLSCGLLETIRRGYLYVYGNVICNSAPSRPWWSLIYKDVLVRLGDTGTSLRRVIQAPLNACRSRFFSPSHQSSFKVANQRALREPQAPPRLNSLNDLACELCDSFAIRAYFASNLGSDSSPQRQNSSRLRDTRRPPPALASHRYDCDRNFHSTRQRHEKN